MRTRRHSHILVLTALVLLPLLSVACSESSPAAPEMPATPAARAEEGEITIVVSPAVLTLGTPGNWVTVHTDISCSEVDRETLLLNGIVPEVVKADNHGDLVAKFVRGDIEAIVAPPEATLTLTGLTVSGAPFSGSDTIVVQ